MPCTHTQLHAHLYTGDVHANLCTHGHTCTVRCTHVDAHTHTGLHIHALGRTHTTTPQHHGRWHGEDRAGVHGAHVALGLVALAQTSRHVGPAQKQPWCMGATSPGGATAPEPQGTRSSHHQPTATQLLGLPPIPGPAAIPRKGGRMRLSDFKYTCQILPPHFCGNDLLRAPRSSSPVRSHQARSFGEIKS